MSRLLVVLLIALGALFGARALFQIGARKFRGTLAGQLLESIRRASDVTGGATEGATRKGATRPLRKCESCGDHVPTDEPSTSHFVCDSCRLRSKRS